MYAPNAFGRRPYSPILCKVIPKRLMISLDKSLAEVVEMAYSGKMINLALKCHVLESTAKP